MPDVIAPLQPPEAYVIGGSHFEGEGHHEGVDLDDADGTALDVGTQVHAAMTGTVTSVRYEPVGYGNVVDVLDTSGRWLTRCAHLSEALVAVGDDVAQGQVIALSGNTPPGTDAHLHWEIRDMSTHLPRGLPVNPTEFLGIAMAETAPTATTGPTPSTPEESAIMDHCTEPITTTDGLTRILAVIADGQVWEKRYDAGGTPINLSTNPDHKGWAPLPGCHATSVPMFKIDGARVTVWVRGPAVNPTDPTSRFELFRIVWDGSAWGQWLGDGGTLDGPPDA